MHATAFFIAIPAGIALVTVAERAAARTAASIYAVSLLVMLGMSAAYHRLAISERAQRIMRKADHATVFLKIAGTYTPICLVALPRDRGIPLLIAAWSIAILGVAIKVFAPQRYIRWSSPLYVALGWVALAGLPTLVRNLTTVEFSLLVVGGLVYSVGAILFWLRFPDPAPLVFGYHEVWHVNTVLASMMHFGVVVLVVTAAT